MNEPIGSGAKRSGILVVSTDPAITTLLTRALSSHGLEVFPARSAENAVAVYASGRIGLVLLDEDLRAADALRGVDPEVRIVLAAGGVLHERPIADLGVIWAVPKPFPNFVRLAARLHELL